MMLRLSVALSAAFTLAITTAFVPQVSNRHTRRGNALSVATFPPPYAPTKKTNDDDDYVAEISAETPLKVLISGAGVGGLALAKILSKTPNIDVTVLERTDAFKRFGGPIQLASNALQVLKEMDEEVFDQIMEKFTFTGDKENGIKDGIRSEWYAKFDLKSPAEARNLPYTGVIERPDLQEIFLNSLPEGCVHNGDGVKSYTKDPKTGAVTVELDSGKRISGDVLIGADGIWSAVRANMRHEPTTRSGAAYSGYTVFAGELNYDSPDNGQVGYKVYIGPQQYFVITDIGKGRYQWYAFLARPAGSVMKEEKPEGSSMYLQNLFEGWSEEVHDILKVTQEHEIEQRDLYDRPPSIKRKSWIDGHVALLGDGIHAMMPNLGQGGCQAIEDAFVLSQELSEAKTRTEITRRLESYHQRRLIRSATVQGLSRFASDIIIRGFDTPTRIVLWDHADEEGQGTKKLLLPPRVENFNYAGIVTRMLQPILPIFFAVQFNFLYDGWKNESSSSMENAIMKNALAIAAIGGLMFFMGGSTAAGDVV